MKLLIICVLFCASSNLIHGSEDIASSSFNVLNFGAVGNGRTDDSPAFLKAWEAVCRASGGTSELVVPAKKIFLLTPLNFMGPCKSNHVIVQVYGNIVAPNSPGGWKNCCANSWICFTSIQNLVINGPGLINGQGSLWWNGFKGTATCQRPTALHLNNCQNLRLTGTYHLNSPRNHISIGESNGVTISNIHVTAPQLSPNTDGIDISASTNINIHDSNIQTGDDCIAINGNTSYVNITGIACGPGHGISVGSLGQNGAYDTVEEVHVRNCTFTRTMNGARIKTWQGGSGYARKVSFDHINLVAVSNPIIIDQYYYCDNGHYCNSMTSAVKISEVTYSNVRGTSAILDAITLNCSQIFKCTNIVMQQINITPSVPGKCYASCENAQGTSTSTSPHVPCLQAT